jgi:hypothetical protein
MKNSTPEKLANKWINEMIEFGLEPEQMLEVLKLAREKLKFLKEAEKINLFKNIHRLATDKGKAIDYKNIKSINISEGMVVLAVKSSQ